MVIADRMTGKIDGEFALFLIGMRFNRPHRIDKWLPVVRAMPKMLRELYENPDLGLLSHETWPGRTLLIIQYWRSLDQLLDYAKNKDAEHLPAWRAFNRAIGTDGSVGIWHETYRIRPGQSETIYVNMPPFGLGKAGALSKVGRAQEAAADRMADH
jgi:hypothetical protein